MTFSGVVEKGKLPANPLEIALEADNTGGLVLINPLTAEVHVVARNHGPPIEGVVAQQTSEFLGGCPPNDCVNVQAAIYSDPFVGAAVDPSGKLAITWGKLRQNRKQYMASKRVDGLEWRHCFRHRHHPQLPSTGVATCLRATHRQMGLCITRLVAL